MLQEQDDVDKQFFEACQTGNLDEVLKILYYDDNGEIKLLKIEPDSHMPYFHTLCFHGHHKVVEQLFVFDVDVNMSSSHGTPLFVACQGGDLKTVQKLVEHGAVIFDPNIIDVNMLPIFEACKNGDDDIFSYLLSQVPDMIDQFGDQLLLQACYGGFLKIVVVLVSKDVDVNGISDCFSTPHTSFRVPTNSIAESPLHAACSQDHIEIVEYLLQEGAEVTTGLVQQFYNKLGQAVHNRNFKEYLGKYKKDSKKKVIEADLRADGFHAIHESWFTCFGDQLVDIDLSNNHLHYIPKEIFSLKCLKKIDVSGNELFELSEICDVMNSSLEEITASTNSLSCIPISFFQIKSLRHLNASNNEIRSLENVPGSPEIDMYMSEEITWHCSALKSLNLSKNQLSSIPHAIHVAISLEKLQLSDNKLEDFPVGWRSPLRILDLSKNKLKDFDESIFTSWRQTMEDLNISDNELTTISWDICQLDTLQRLNLSNNKIERMPPISYWTCKNLRRLILSNNKLCGVHLEVSSPSPRQRLSLSLSFSSPPQDLVVQDEDQFPYEVYGETLEALLLDNNQLTEIPSSLCKLIGLEELELSWNPKLKTLPAELGNLVDCHILGLEGLNLTGIPRYARPGRNVSSKDLLTFLRAKQRKSVPYYRMKLMVVGHQGRGKTTLLAALRGKQLPSNISTVGIVVNEWTMGTANKLFSKFAKSNITFSTWDLAGQQVYYSTHQCFLSSNTLYLAVWNATHGDEGIEKLKPWLLNVQARAPGSIVIIVGTHIDLLPQKTKKMRVDKLKQEIIKKYRKKGYPLIKGNFLVSCTTGENMATLRRIIYDVALQIKESESLGKGEQLIGRMVPLSYLKFQENVIKESQKRKKEDKPPILNEKEMLDLANQDPNNDILTKEELLLAARFLHENGVILHYNDRSRGLDQLYFIEPGWLCDIMALLVTVKENNAFVKGGIVNKSNIKLMLRNPRLPQEFMEQYIQLMERFEVALILDEQSLLVPSMLPRDKPGMQLPKMAQKSTSSQEKPPNPDNHSGSILNESEYLVRLYKMNYVPSGFWSRLIARLMIAVQRWGAEEGLGDELVCNEEGKTVHHTSSVRPVPSGYSMIYWREGVGVVYDGGHLIVESFTDKERHSFTEAVEEIEGVKVTVWSAEQDFSVLGFVTDQINSLISEWYPGLEENDNFGVPLVRHVIPCPTCAARMDSFCGSRALSMSSNLRRTTSVDSFPALENKKPREFSLTECAAAAVCHKEISCPGHMDKPVKLDCLVPDLMLSDLPEELIIDPTRFYFNPVEDNRLGCGGAGEVFLGTYKKQRVAIKRFYSTKETWRDSGIHSDAYIGNHGKTRHTESSISSNRPVFTTNHVVTLEEELQRSKILSSFWELRQEVTVLARLSHPCVVSLVGVCVQPLSIVLELSPCGSLYSILEKELREEQESRFSTSHQATIDIRSTIFERELTYRMVYQVIHALCYLHDSGIIYRDLKSDNLLVWSLDKDAVVHVKLSDYGISRFATPQGMLGEEGTPGFQAPEVRSGATYNEKVDIFSFAMVIYEILSGYRPYHECRSSSQMKKAVRRGDRPSLEQNSIDSKMPEMESLMRRCWRESIFARPSADAICERMQDPTFLCLTRVLPYADQKPWANITAFIPLSPQDQVFDDPNSKKGDHSVLIWGGENEERYYAIIDCQTGFIQVPDTLCIGPRVACIAKVGDRYWLGTEGLSIDVFGRPKFGGDLRVLWSFKLKAPVLSLLVDQDKEPRDPHVRRVFASLANGKVVIISRTEYRQTSSTSSSLYFRSDGTEKLRQEAAIFSVTTTVDVASHQIPVCCMLFVKDGKELWVGCGNYVSVLDVSRLEVIHKFRAYVSPRTNVRAMVTDGKSVFTINRQTAVLRQWDIASYSLLYNFNCDLENAQGCIIAEKATDDTNDETPTGESDDAVNSEEKSPLSAESVLSDPQDSVPTNPRIIPDIPQIHRRPPSLMRSLRRSPRHPSRDNVVKATRGSPRTFSIRSRTQVLSRISQRITCALVVDGNLWLGRGITGDIVVVDISCSEDEGYGRVLGVLSLGKEQGFIKREIDCLRLVGGNLILSSGRLCREKQEKGKGLTVPAQNSTTKRSFIISTSPFKTLLKPSHADSSSDTKDEEVTQQPTELNQLAIWLRWEKDDFRRFFKYHKDLEKASEQQYIFI